MLECAKLNEAGKQIKRVTALIMKMFVDSKTDKNTKPLES